MEFDHVILADSANHGPDSKLNILGAGARLLTYERLPGISPLVLIASASARTDEAGEYPIEVAIVEPDGTREVILRGTGVINREVDDDRVPTGMGVILNMMRPFRIEGVHRFVVSMGALTKTYEFLVRVGVPGERAPAGTAAVAAGG